MKNLFLIGLLSLLLGCSESSTPGDELAPYRGQWLLVNYWAQWCKPCIEEIPELNRIHAELENVAVVGVNYDNAQGDELAAQLEQLGVAFDTLSADPAAQVGTQRPQVLPTTLVLNPEGKLVKTLLGPQTFASLAAATGQAHE